MNRASVTQFTETSQKGVRVEYTDYEWAILDSQPGYVELVIKMKRLQILTSEQPQQGFSPPSLFSFLLITGWTKPCESFYGAGLGQLIVPPEWTGTLDSHL